ncbi:MAG: hypothetical protein K0S74_871 [Chlamydiales bacterium]|jgi:hypothetical protein|nr:hypothetical protein [Chlamydiales bacterium]
MQVWRKSVIKGKRLFISLGAILAPITLYAAQVNVGLDAGYRSDRISMSYAKEGMYTDTTATPATSIPIKDRQRNKITSLKTFFMEAKSELLLDKLVLRANLQHGWILKGYREKFSKEILPSGGSTILSNAQRKQKSSGHIWEGKVAVGHLVDVTPTIVLEPQIGFFIDQMKLNKEKLSDHKVRHYSPFVGALLKFNVDSKINVHLGTEVHLFSNYRENFTEMDVSGIKEKYSIKSKKSNIIWNNNLTVYYAITDKCSLNLGLNYRYSRDKPTNFSSSSNTNGQVLSYNKAIGKRYQRTAAAMLGVNYRF